MLKQTRPIRNSSVAIGLVASMFGFCHFCPAASGQEDKQTREVVRSSDRQQDNDHLRFRWQRATEQDEQIVRERRRERVTESHRDSSDDHGNRQNREEGNDLSGKDLSGKVIDLLKQNGIDLDSGDVIVNVNRSGDGTVIIQFRKRKVENGEGNRNSRRSSGDGASRGQRQSDQRVEQQIEIRRDSDSQQADRVRRDRDQATARNSRGSTDGENVFEFDVRVDNERNQNRDNNRRRDGDRQVQRIELIQSDNRDGDRRVIEWNEAVRRERNDQQRAQNSQNDSPDGRFEFRQRSDDSNPRDGDVIRRLNLLERRMSEIDRKLDEIIRKLGNN